MSPTVLDPGAVASRRTARAKLGALRDLRVGPLTLRRYREAAERFAQWQLSVHLPNAESLHEMDRQLCVYLNVLWEDGAARALAGDTLSGVQHFLGLRRQFPGSWRLLSVWQRLEIPARAPPLPRDALLALAGFALAEGSADVAALLVLGYHCCLRTNEMLSVKREDLALGSDFKGVLALPWTKKGQRHGARELVSIDDCGVGLLIAAAAGSLAGRQHVLQGDSRSFRRFFDRALKALGLSELRFRPYSLRRGGATFDFLSHQDINRTLFRGRWSDLRTGRIYVTDGAAALTSLTISPTSQTAIAQFAGYLAAYVASLGGRG